MLKRKCSSVKKINKVNKIVAGILKQIFMQIIIRNLPRGLDPS